MRDEPRLTRAWEVVHTPGYAAPEVFTDADPDPRQDLYAAGVVLVEMLTAQRPRSDGSVEVPAGPFAAVVERLVDPDPRRRPATAAEAGAALSAVPVPPHAGEPVEVFSHLPEWPEGWSPDGPDGSAGAHVAARVEPVTAARSVPTEVDPTAIRDADPTRRRPVAPRQPLPAPPVARPAAPREPVRRPADSRRGAPVAVWMLAVAGVGLVVAALVTGVR